MTPAASISAQRLVRGPLASRRLLALAGDERLVEQIRAGNEAAFEVVFERHGGAILGFCRHMLGAREEAEDVVQHTFAAAHRDLLRRPDREITLKPWLFTIARNRCLSVLRDRREHPGESVDVATVGLSEQVERRADLRQMLSDLAELPDEQRAALLLAEVGDLSHADVANVLGCETARVKALVFRARTMLIQRRDAREAPCEQVQEKLANLRRGALRRNEIRMHLRECAACRSYRDQVRVQRGLMAAALPVTPSLGLKAKVLAAVGIGGGSSGAGLAAGLTGLGGAFSGAIGNATVAKVVAVGLLAGGGVVAERAVETGAEPRAEQAAAAAVVTPASAREPAQMVAQRRAMPERETTSRGARTATAARDRARERAARRAKRGRTRAGRALGAGRAKPEKPAKVKPERGRARGPVAAPPAATPVRRGPPDTPKPAPKVKVENPAPAIAVPEPPVTLPEQAVKVKPAPKPR